MPGTPLLNSAHVPKASSRLPSPAARLAAPSLSRAGLESAQPHRLLQPIPTCLLSPDETTNPSQYRTVFLCLPQRTGGGGAGGRTTGAPGWRQHRLIDSAPCAARG